VRKLDRATYFVGIGAPKAGTSWISRQLYRNPGVMRSVLKEMHVFDYAYGQAPRRATGRIEELRASMEARLATMPLTHDHRRQLQRRLREVRAVIELRSTTDRALRVDRYRQYFVSRRRPAHRAFGEFTPSYALLPREGFAEILEAFPEARFIFVMRDPVDRMWSAARVSMMKDPDFDASTSRLRRTLMRASEYETTLAVLDEVVPPEQLFMCFYEDLFVDDKVMRDLAVFLGLEPIAPELTTVVGMSPVAVIPPEREARWARRLRPTYEAVFERMGRLPPRWIEREQIAGVATAMRVSPP
jgi:hypothetical protein